MSEFKDKIVPKRWGWERELFNNGVVSCWYLRINAGEETSLHMHEQKETAMVLLNGKAVLQEGLNHAKPIDGLDKSRFSRRFFHKHSAITDCDLLEFETPINKLDVHRLTDKYGRAGEPYESVRLDPTGDEPDFGDGRVLTIGATELEIYDFGSRHDVDFLHSLRPWTAIALLSGALRSKEGVLVSAPGDVVWAQNLPSLMRDRVFDGPVSVMTIQRQDEWRI